MQYWLLISCTAAGLMFFNSDVKSSDTLVLAKTNRYFTINSNQLMKSIELEMVTRNNKDGKNVYILFDQASVTRAPEGIYEVYLSPQPGKRNALTSKSPFFAGVIDPYSLQKNHEDIVPVPGINITGNWIYLRSKKKSLSGNYYLTIIFRGNSKSNKTASDNAGSISFKQIRVVQIS